MSAPKKKRPVGRPPKWPRYVPLRPLILLREDINKKLAEERAEAKRRGKRFDTQEALGKVIPGLRMSIASLRVLLSNKRNRKKVDQILRSWREGASDPRYADGADPDADRY